MTYVRLWRFVTSDDRREAFLAAYGPEGDWAELFRRASGYRGTELLQSTADPTVFVTIDRWDCEADWSAFLKRHADAYAALDVRCEHLTTAEDEIGAWLTPGGDA